MARRRQPTIPDALLDQLLAGADPKSAFAPNGLLDSLKKALTERALNAEMDHHLSGDEEAGNGRNGYGRKTVLTETGKLELEIPRDRRATFDPQLIAKYQRRFPGFDDKIVSMYARGMSVREIAGHLRELYGVEVSPDLISTVTDAVLDEITAWQARPLEPVYPLVFFDALRVKVRDKGALIALRSGSSNTRARLRRGSATRRSTSRLACAPMAPRRSSACGWSRTRAPSSGCGS
jgi:putative transposase